MGAYDLEKRGSTSETGRTITEADAAAIAKAIAAKNAAEDDGEKDFSAAPPDAGLDVSSNVLTSTGSGASADVESSDGDDTGDDGNDTDDEADGASGTPPPTGEGNVAADAAYSVPEGTLDDTSAALSDAALKAERARQAYGRRKREMEAEARRLADESVAEIIGALGLIDAEGNQITTAEQARKFSEKTRLEKFNEHLREGALTAEDIAILRGTGGSAAGATGGAAQEAPQFTALVAGQLTRIAREFNPGIKGVDDILAMDTADDFKRLVSAGSDFYEAYRLANAEAIAKKRAAATAQQQAINSASKSHLKGSTGNAPGKPEVNVPSDIIDEYLKVFPDMTEVEIKADYKQRMARSQNKAKSK
ncbi:MAG: hypothetical protein LBK23_09575 [Oscillospiraceae bacterium]|nr:hypothetical protein [Oscillospiraceae bacterium]